MIATIRKFNLLRYASDARYDTQSEIATITLLNQRSDLNFFELARSAFELFIYDERRDSIDILEGAWDSF